MSKGKEFIKNTIILLLGKFTTQFMSILLLPLYTNRLEVSNFGTVDLIQTYLSLLVPVLTLRMDSATFRFLIDQRKSPEKTRELISNILAVSVSSVFVALVVAIILSFFVQIPFYLYVCLNLFALMISGILLQILRGLGKTILYAIASIITGLTTLIVNIILILGLNQGAESILLSSTIANLVCVIFVFFGAKLYKNFSHKLIQKKIIKQFLKYSIPMVPNSLSWWVVNVSDRTIIRIFLNAAANGIYTVSCKFSNIINSVFSIFNMSWQESASLHIDEPDRDEFFSKMINQLFIFFASSSLLILGAIPIFYDILIGKQYIEAYDYIPVLLYANAWNILITLIGGIYVAKKRTKEIANTTIISAIINLVVNLALINFIGIHAATISTLVSYMAMAIYRIIDCQKYVKYKFDIVSTIIFSIVFIVSTIIYHVNNPVLNIVNFVFVSLYVVFANRKNVKNIVSMLKRNKSHNKIDKNTRK